MNCPSSMLMISEPPLPVQEMIIRDNAIAEATQERELLGLRRTFPAQERAR